MLRDQANRYVHEVLGCHERARDLRDERIDHDVGNSDQQNHAEDPVDHLGQKVEVQELRLQSFLQRGSVKVHTNPIFGFPLDRWLFFNLSVHSFPLLTPLFAGRIQTPK